MKNLLSQLGTFGIVTVVTILVWLYAEDANIEAYTDQPVQLQFIVPEGNLGLMTPSGPITVQVDFDASNGQQQQLAEVIGEGPKQLPLPLTMETDFEEREVDLRQLLEENIFRDLGVNITGVRPAAVTVGFEKLISVAVPIEGIEVEGEVLLAEPPRLAESDLSSVLISNLPAGRRPELEDVSAKIVLRAEDLARLELGVEAVVPAAVVLSDRIDGVAPSRGTVDVIVRRANDRGTVTIDRRPILLSYPSSINERYIVSIDEAARFITSFELEGPRAQIDMLKQDPSTGSVWASVRLTNEEADAAVANGGEISKQVDIQAPDGVSLSSDVVRVTVKVAARDTSGTANP